MAKNFKLIKGVNASPLKKLNEGEVALKNPDKYVFLGVFTQCSTPEHKVVNRNGRIYMEKEVLRHLGYLRDMIKENNGRLLGELDHPEGRFDVQMKEASHMITDLWYDDNTKCVMGKLEVLDTPNGKTLRSLIDAGFPLYVSSRAAGDVDERTKEVEIAQIFTYDVVCTPGFKEARLERVNESLLTDKALKYINESVSEAKEIIGKQDIEVPASAINESIAKFAETTVSDVCTPLLEEDATDKEPLNDATPQNFLKIQDTTGKKEEKKEELKEEDGEAEKEAEKPAEEESEEGEAEEADKDEESEDAPAEDEESEEKEGGLTDEEKEENRALILDVVGLDADGEPVGDAEEDQEDSESEEKGDDILDVEAVADEDGESEADKETEETEELAEEPSEEDEANEDVEVESAGAKVAAAKKDAIKKQTKADMDEIDALLASVEKAEGVKESIIRRYPFAISLSESNFAKFAGLRPKLKKRCADFIEENEIYDIRAINELWSAPLREDKKMQQNWLKLASQADIDLYVAAPVEVQNAIEESAKYVILETAEDVDLFWHRTGLRQQAAQRLMNEQMVREYQQNISESNQFRASNPLGYSQDFISMTERWFNNN